MGWCVRAAAHIVMTHMPTFCFRKKEKMQSEYTVFLIVFFYFFFFFLRSESRDTHTSFCVVSIMHDRRLGLGELECSADLLWILEKKLNCLGSKICFPLLGTIHHTHFKNTIQHNVCNTCNTTWVLSTLNPSQQWYRPDRQGDSFDSLSKDFWSFCWCFTHQDMEGIFQTSFF